MRHVETRPRQENHADHPGVLSACRLPLSLQGISSHLNEASVETTPTPPRTAHVFLLSIALLAAFPCTAGAKDVLDPCSQEQITPYHRAVNNVIDSAVGRPASLQLTRFPSFEVESGIRLAGTELYFIKLKSSFWADSVRKTGVGSWHMDFTQPKPVTRVSHVTVDAGLARRMEQVYADAIAAAGRADETGLDGESFVFALAGHGCGTTWSPRPGTRNARLVELMERLQRHATLSTPIDVRRGEKALVKFINTLETK